MDAGGGAPGGGGGTGRCSCEPHTAGGLPRGERERAPIEAISAGGGVPSLSLTGMCENHTSAGTATLMKIKHEMCQLFQELHKITSKMTYGLTSGAGVSGRMGSGEPDGRGGS